MTYQPNTDGDRVKFMGWFLAGVLAGWAAARVINGTRDDTFAKVSIVSSEH